MLTISGNPDYGDKVDSLYEITNLCTTLFSLPGVVTDVYLHYGFEWIYSIIHLVVPCVPFFLYLLNDKSVDEGIIDLTVFGNAASMAIQCFTRKNYFGLYAAICQTVNHFVLKKKEFQDVPKEVLYNLGMCFYTYFAYRTFVDW